MDQACERMWHIALLIISISWAQSALPLSLPFLIPMLLSEKLAISSTCSALCWSAWTGTRFLAIAGNYYTIANCFMALLQWPALVLHGLRYVEAE